LKVEQTPKVVVQDVVITITTEEAKVLYRILDTIVWDSLPAPADSFAAKLADKLGDLPEVSWTLGNYSATAKINGGGFAEGS